MCISGNQTVCRESFDLARTHYRTLGVKNQVLKELVTRNGCLAERNRNGNPIDWVDTREPAGVV